MTPGENHKINLHRAAVTIINKEFEGNSFVLDIPKESARLETLSYGEAEALLVKAHDNYIRVSTYLAQVSAALAYYKRFVAMKEKMLMGDPDLQKEAKNEAQRERNVAMNSEYQEYLMNLRTAEEVVAYFEQLTFQARETLQVVKKIRDASWQRSVGSKPVTQIEY